jgi:hypothetical protein
MSSTVRGKFQDKDNKEDQIKFWQSYIADIENQENQKNKQNQENTEQKSDNKNTESQDIFLPEGKVPNGKDTGNPENLSRVVKNKQKNRSRSQVRC